MNYRLLDYTFEFRPKVIIAQRIFSFTLPGLNKTVVAHGKYIIEEPTLIVGSMNFRLDMDNLPLISFDWIHKKLPINTSRDKSIDRSMDFTETIKKRTKGWEKKDTKAIIDAFEHDIQEVYKNYLAVKAKTTINFKKVTKNDKISKKRR